MSKINLGTPSPLGSSLTARGVNFSVASPNAIHLELLIFEKENSTKPQQIISLNQNHRSGDYWHVEVEGLNLGALYGFRVYTKENPEKSNKVLLDPCARSIACLENYKRDCRSKHKDDFSNCLKSVVSERDTFDFNLHPRPRHPWDKTVIYELHVGGFTNNIKNEHSSDQRGTFISLIEKIPYIKELGITTIELLPVFVFDTNDCPAGLRNYWGYSPLNWFTPHYSFVDKTNKLSPRDQFRKFVAACHDNQLEVILDVVYNHTTEGNNKGPVISWKGFDDSLYYFKNNKGDYLDVSGCGNSIAANRPLVRQLIIDSLTCWSQELGVDGFRFDLGIALTRGEDLKPLNLPPLFEEIESDPSLSDLKLISEPWDCGGLYRLNDFPAKRIKTWNGHFRDDVRKFWKGDKNTTWPLKDRLRGSRNLYKDEKSLALKTINFITSHDGFTLNDLVSFNIKHNYANGENNCDGENHNNSWNHGVEGPSTDKRIVDLRNKQKRNLLSSLLLSPGVPMILMGDEVGRSQGGNNNAWCQDSPLGWMIWHPENCDEHLQTFVKKLLMVREKLPEFFSAERLIKEKPSHNATVQEGLWIQWNGIKLNKPDWSSWSHTISYSIHDGAQGAVLWLGLNAYSESMSFELPKPISPWKQIINTSCIDTKKSPIALALPNQESIEMQSRSLVLLLASKYANKIKK